MNEIIYRTHNCGELCKKDIGKNVVLSGWIQKLRNLGSITFIDLRDYFGITQLILSKKLKKKNPELGKEFIIKISGIVGERVSKNYKIYTGEIEVFVSQLEILNYSTKPPFLIEDQTDGDEVSRMKYRYLDIRRNPIKNNLKLRHKISLEIRNFLSKNGFLEIETPILINHTPEGARSFVVPSRIHSRKFYSLPQSPQLFKQLLMIGGIDRYFQIVKCFRDEDARSDRQIEFTQIDCEMVFVNVNDILSFFENFIKHIFKEVKNIQLEPFKRISYSDAIKMYGTDTPDIQIDIKFLELKDFFFKRNSFFLKKKEFTMGVSIPNRSHYTCEKINFIIEQIKQKELEIETIFWLKYFPDKTFFSSMNSFMNNEEDLVKYFKANPGDLLFIFYGIKTEKKHKLNQLRLEIIHCLNLIEKRKKTLKPLWIIDFPLLEWNENIQKYKPFHHPFTNPKKEDVHFLEHFPENVRSQSYDLIINGVEIGGGSIRIHNKNIQNLILKHLGLSTKEIQSQFGFFINAFEYGVPPHGGIAFGLDRLISILEGKENIKEFIAFPKNNSGKDLMINAPYFLEKNKLKELNLLL
ncbi:aspartate--tRNA ligase [Blattabacterium cuenoti]|uniref:aspartate--tRNA ligase n=1 Tax=Blattabacterium cuenoti TaxID=1653831 RepID=UPI00163BBF1C|nr:aspartate--tRNA ligase [Blattabacterium cuenoti]